MRIASILIAAAVPLLLSLPAAALEPFKVYDRFAGQPIDPDRWFETERVREIKAGSLRLMQKNWGGIDSDSGLFNYNWADSFTQAASVTAMQARITVDAVDVNACASNAGVNADARARLVGTFFNVGTPTPGSYLGDVFVQARLYRSSASTDPTGVLKVGGVVQVCTSSDCNTGTLIGSVVDLGTASLGTPVTLSLQWDRPTKTFYFSRDSGAYSGLVTYTESDASPPGFLLRQIATRMSIPNCATAGRVGALIDARFDNVLVNRSALP